jgi:hypothetical protein
VRGAIESTTPGELAAQGEKWAVAAVTNGAHRHLHAAITQMDDGELEKKSFLWKQAAACVGFRTPDPELRVIRALASGGGTESGPIVELHLKSWNSCLCACMMVAVVRLLITGPEMHTKVGAHVSAQSNAAARGRAIIMTCGHC